MKLIKELVSPEMVETKTLLEESTGQKSYYIAGPFLQAEVKNRNGRVYPLQTMMREVARYTQEMVAEKRAMGELGHPDNPSINLDRASHLIVSLEQNGNDFFGKAKVMSTPMGQIVKNLIDEGVKLGVSSRGLGTLKSTPQGNVVGEDFYLATAADVVADPSAPNAFVQGIMEGREWVWNNGIIKEADVAKLQKQVSSAPRKRSTARRIDEAKAFDTFLKMLRVETTFGDK